jgi:hypothetical protein
MLPPACGNVLKRRSIGAHMLIKVIGKECPRILKSGPRSLPFNITNLVKLPRISHR